MKTLLIVFLGFFIFELSLAGEKKSSSSCPTFHSKNQIVRFKSNARSVKKVSHRRQLKKQTPSSCRKKRRTGEVQRFLKIE